MFQVVAMSFLVYLSSSGTITSKKKKKKLEPYNNICMVFSFLVTVLNIFITVFDTN